MEEPMIVRSLHEIQGTDRDVAGEGWQSRRLLLASDGMGFSLHDTTVAAGEELELEYRHHLEACYCVSGSAEIEDLATGERHAIGPGTAYALDQHDRHVLRVAQDLRLVCVFNPPLTGRERHVGGGYEAADDSLGTR
jgi:L-ectoine synthase